MKLLFPNGEHEPVELKDGDTVVGSASDCQVMLAAPGIGARHCVLRTRGEQTTVRPLDAQAPTVLNGRADRRRNAPETGRSGPVREGGLPRRLCRKNSRARGEAAAARHRR